MAFKAHVRLYLDAAERGETIVIARVGRPIARLVPVRFGKSARVRRALEQPYEILARWDAELAKLNEPGTAKKIDEVFARRGRLRKRPKAAYPVVPG